MYDLAQFHVVIGTPVRLDRRLLGFMLTGPSDGRTLRAVHVLREVPGAEADLSSQQRVTDLSDRDLRPEVALTHAQEPSCLFRTQELLRPAAPVNGR